METTILTMFDNEITGTYVTLFDENYLNKNIVAARTAGSRYEKIVFENVNFENCHFQSTDFINVKFIDCTFKNCTFNFVKLNGCNLIACKFENCSLCITNSLNCNFLSCTYINNNWENCSHNGHFINCNIDQDEMSSMNFKFNSEASDSLSSWELPIAS